MEKAFDKVDRSLLLLKMLDCGVDGYMYQAIKSLCMNSMYTVNLNGLCTSWFDAKMGVRQGDCISPTLFALFINDLALDIKNLNCGVRYGDLDISILLYADDVVLISETEENLQQMLNMVSEWCRKWRLKCSSSKSKAVHFRHKSTTRTNYQFKIGDENISCVDRYKYLGVIFDEHLLFDVASKALADSAGRALGKLVGKLKYLNGLGWNTYTKLYESYVDPILTYGSGIWGYKHVPWCDTIQNRAIRIFLGVHRFAPNLAVNGDMGWFSTQNKRHQCMLRLWNRLIRLEDTRLCKQIFYVDLRHPNNWSSDICKLLTDLDMRETFVNKDTVDIKNARLLKHDRDKETWQINRFSYPKLRTYNVFKSEYCTEHYVKTIFHRGKRSILSQFRTGILPLKVETGRFTNIPWYFRICELCTSNDIEDEIHFLLHCTCYTQERNILFAKALESHADFLQYEDDAKIYILLNDEDLTKPLAEYLYICYMKRRNYMFSP